jgi:hypothetical protein
MRARDHACRDGARNPVSQPGTSRAFFVRSAARGRRDELTPHPRSSPSRAGRLSPTVAILEVGLGSENDIRPESEFLFRSYSDPGLNRFSFRFARPSAYHCL